ncbi:MAG: NADH-quinone oxidoreductase subunit N [Bacteroidota bacterium]|nr:NADH-quinone oxidoreductase subunit N [Bacteroidota bacterium]
MNAIIFSALSGVAMMFTGIFTTNKSAIRNVAVIALLGLIIVNLLHSYGIFVVRVNTHSMLQFETFGLFFNTLVFAATLLFVLLSGKDVTNAGTYGAEYFALIFFVLCGVSILTCYNSLLMLFIGIEILSIPLYILTGADKRNLKSNEASLKYFLMGSFSTGILLMGITLVYGITGTFSIEAMRPAVSVGAPNYGILEPVGLLFIFIALLFKVSAAPFHFWTPDVYDGAPTVFTSFMATIVKAAGFVSFIRLFDARAIEMGISWKIILPVIIIATLLIGNITAVFQQSVKRMMAYSSIAQAGFMLFAVYVNNDMSKEGILLYTAAYSIATIGIFAILTRMKDITFDGFNGLAKKHPVLAATNAVFLLSLAGIPLTAGFFAKYYMLAAVVKENGAGALWLVIVAVLFAAVSVYYYFRVIQAMYFKEGEPEITEVSGGFKTALVMLAVLIVLIGTFPSALLNWFYF